MVRTFRFQADFVKRGTAYRVPLVRWFDALPGSVEEQAGTRDRDWGFGVLIEQFIYTTIDRVPEVRMTIGKTVEIPADRRLHLDFEVPIEIPVGKAQVELKVIPFVNKQNKSALKNTDKSLTPHTDALFKIFSNLGDIDIDEIREERLAKHL